MENMHPVLVRSAERKQDAFVPIPEFSEIYGRYATGENVVIWGAPGTGKTRTLIQLAAALVADSRVSHAGLLFLTASRRQAVKVRDELTEAIGATISSTAVRTWSSLAFGVLQEFHAFAQDGEMLASPAMLTGAEQDVLIAELLSGHVHTGSEPAWPNFLREALATRGFRKELRDFIDRLSERGQTPASLASFVQTHKPAKYAELWMAIADFYQEYLDVKALRMPDTYEAASLVAEATQVLRDNPGFREKFSQQFSAIFVDDAQELSPGMLHLLETILSTPVGSGKQPVRAVCTVCPETVVQGFRGARADLALRLPERLSASGLTVAEVQLHSVWRGSRDLVEQRRHIAGLLAGHRKATWYEDLQIKQQAGSDSAAESKTLLRALPSEVEAAEEIADLIVREVVENDVSWSDIAVIARSSAGVSFLERTLSTRGIPVVVPGAQSAVRDQPAAKALLWALDAVLHPESLTVEKVELLLTSKLVTADAMSIRRLRQALRAERAGETALRRSDDLLVEAVQDPKFVATLGESGAPAAALAAILAAGRESLAAEKTDAHRVLWQMWEAANVSDQWQDIALSRGVRGSEADADLDAIVALFEMVESFVLALPGAGAEQFLEHISSQEIPSDLLAPRAAIRDAVTISTPAHAAGEEWQVVFITELQEGVWPDTRVRGELLGTGTLVDLLDGTVRDYRTAVRQTWDDELRQLISAISVAHRRVYAIAVSSEDSQPSVFFELLSPNESVDSTIEPSSGHSSSAPRGESRERVSSLRHAVALFRRNFETAFRGSKGEGSVGSGDIAANDVQWLAYLRRQGLQVADPENWWGLLPLSSTSALWTSDEAVPISPSRVATILDNPLEWFVSFAGGTVPPGEQLHIGTLVHQVAQEFPEGGLPQLRERLDELWPGLDIPSGWQHDALKQRVLRMVEFYAEYVENSRRDHRSVVAVEQRFTAQVGRALLKGSVDRLEKDAEGRARIIDFKTGSTTVSAQKIAEHPQLGVYQLAVLSGAFESLGLGEPGGAALVQLGTKNKHVKEEVQQGLSAEDATETWVHELVHQAVDAVSGEKILSIARLGKERNASRVEAFSSLYSRGRQVTE